MGVGLDFWDKWPYQLKKIGKKIEKTFETVRFKTFFYNLGGFGFSMNTQMIKVIQNIELLSFSIY